MPRKPPTDCTQQHAGRREFLDWLAFERDCSKHTLDAYGTDLRLFDAFLARRDIHRYASVSTDTLREFLAHERKRGMAPRTLARRRVTLRLLFRFLSAEGYLEPGAKDPAENLAAQRMPRPLPGALTQSAVKQLLAEPAQQQPTASANAPSTSASLALRDTALLETLYATGARISEVLGMRIPDVMLDSGMARVLGKRRRERMVLLGRAACVALDDWIRRGRPRLAPPPGESRVFLSRTGKPLDRVAAWNMVRKHARSAMGSDTPTALGGKSISPHIISNTQIYTHIDRRALHDMHDRFHPRA